MVLIYGASVSHPPLLFNFSAVSRRSLGEDTPPVGLTVWRDMDETLSETEKEKEKVAEVGIVIEDVIVRYSDGPAMMLSGGRTTLRDCLFEWNDWTAVGGSWPLGVPTNGKAHRATTVWADDDDGLVVERVTFRNNGTCGHSLSLLL